MRRCEVTAAITVAGLLTIPAFAGGGGWVEFNNETSTRLPTPLNDPSLSTTDTDEKDYAFGDVDQDGDMDLVVVRKQEFTTTGRRENVLFMNEGVDEGHSVNGVFVDSTNEHIPEFETPTNDRDVQLVDVDNDGWLDIVTATTLTDNSTKDLSHPRVYMNQGENGGVWQGYVYEGDRIPQMHATAGPRFCSVAYGDVNDDGYMDLYFGDYDSGGFQIHDYNNKLLINRGVAQPGYFDDESTMRMGGLFNYPGTGFQNLLYSAFGAASEIRDMNGDGYMDVIKQTSLNAPTHIAVKFNDPSNPGMFDPADYLIVDSASPYFVTVGDLNGDGLLDMVVVDDGNDKYYLNNGNGGNGNATFSSTSIGSITGGFGGNAIIADLNNDNLNDVIITDVDVDISGCTRTTRILRNVGGSSNILQNETHSIPDNMLNGVHDAAVFDINNDGYLDIVMGRCSSTEIYINVPPAGILWTYPEGRPAFVTPGETTTFTVQLEGIGAVEPDRNSGEIFVSVNGGPFQSSNMPSLGGNLYEATLPATTCADQLDYYFLASVDGGSSSFTDPPAAPGATYSAVSAEGIELLLRDDLEEDTSAWLVQNDPSLTSGAWEVADPNGTISGGAQAAPEDDATQGAENTMAFVTGNGAPGGAAGSSDVDGGPTRLITPAFNAGGDAVITYARWAFSSGDDMFTVDISDNGGSSWTSIPEQSTGSTQSSWETVSFVVSDYITPSNDMRVRFSVSDSPNNSVTEGGVDNFQVEVLVCDDGLPCDIDGDGVIGVNDLLQLLAEWGPCPGCGADLDGDDFVGVNDLLALLAGWGPCE